MLRLNSYSGLGRTIDPGIYFALRTAGEVLRSQGDPGAPQTAELIRRNIEAPGFPSIFGKPKGKVARVSDLNSTLETVALAREHPYSTIATIIGVPVLAFLLGRATGKRR